ncbi:MAG: histidine kinase [Pseudomonadota bacterium]
MAELSAGTAPVPQRPAVGPFARWPQLTDLLIALLSFVLTLTLWSRGPDGGALKLDSFADVGIVLTAFVGNLALLWRRSHPLQVHAVVLGALVLVYFGSPSDGVVALSFSLYSLGRYEADFRASLVGMLFAFAFVATDHFVLNTPSAGGTMASGMIVALWYTGRRLRFRGEYLRLLEERADHLERERLVEAERAVAAERARIAREMHDIVAHQLSVMTVQAGAAKTVSRADPEAAREAMASVEKAGRQAVAEMRELLGVLRPVEGARELAPQPGVGDLPALIGEVRDVGPTVHLDLEGPVADLPPHLGLAVYRIVQESLTNVIRHAGVEAQVEVRVDVLRDEVAVRIDDNGTGGSTDGSGGHGIIGMRERIELLGGSFSAGPCEEGGFGVRATLPLERGSN